MSDRYIRSTSGTWHRAHENDQEDGATARAGKALTECARIVIVKERRNGPGLDIVGRRGSWQPVCGECHWRRDEFDV